MKTFSLLSFLLLLFCQSCSYNKIFKSHDYLANSTKYEYTYSARAVKKFRPTPIQSVKQTLNKDIDSNKTISYFVYDLLNAKDNSMDYEKKVVYIIDNQPFSMAIDSMAIQTKGALNQHTSEVLKADSTKATVVTGYSIDTEKYIQFFYHIPSEVMNKIANSKSFFFYYQSPNNISRQMRKLKKLIKAAI